MARKPHWLPAGGPTKTPQVIVSFDTETRSATRGKDEVMTLRCWDAIVRCRSDALDLEPITRPVGGESAGQLAAVLESAAMVAGEAWCFAHNVGFDLTVTSLPMVLTERGWATDFVSIGDEACVFVLKRDGCKLVITDSWSWLRSPLAAAAKDVRMRSTALPGPNDDLAVWHRRCAHDVKILDALLSDLLDWWDREQLGAFGITGAACGWRSLRAHLAPKSILAGPEGLRTVFERQALYSGRKEVWLVGEVKRQWVADYDLIAAHLTTVANLPLPVLPIRDGRIGLIADPLRPPEGLGTICEVAITTAEPCAPAKINGEVWWPTGTFRTVLTSIELAHVLEVAEEVEVLQASWYRLGDALQPWGQWCLDLLAGERDDVPAVVRRVAKGWGRSVPGRFALRVSQLTGERPATHLGWAIESGVDLIDGTAVEAISWGGVERTYRKDQDGGDVSPCVLAFVEGYVRAAMARTLAGRDPGRLLQCNTDGWWETCRNGRETLAPDAAPEPFSVTRRAHERGITVIGPNHVETASERRLSGVPKDAAQADDGAYRWQDWPGLRWQLEFSRPGEYVRPARGMTLQPHYCRRWVLDGGETVPATATLGPDARTMLLPWAQTSGRFASDVLAAVQVPALAALAGGDAGGPFPPRPAELRRPGRRSRSSS